MRKLPDGSNVPDKTPLTDVPSQVYGRALASNDQCQGLKLSQHFRNAEYLALRRCSTYKVPSERFECAKWRHFF
jgi:hypothetical protein